MHDDNMFGDVRMDSFPPDMIAKARNTVCRMATDATEARELMRMLGLVA